MRGRKKSGRRKGRGGKCNKGGEGRFRKNIKVKGKKGEEWNEGEGRKEGKIKVGRGRLAEGGSN